MTDLWILVFALPIGKCWLRVKDLVITRHGWQSEASDKVDEFLFLTLKGHFEESRPYHGGSASHVLSNCCPILAWTPRCFALKPRASHCAFLVRPSSRRPWPPLCSLRKRGSAWSTWISSSAAARVCCEAGLC